LKFADTIVVFTKAPLAGMVKTRLLDRLSAAQAAEVHRACLEDTMRLIETLPQCARWLFVTPGPSGAAAGSLPLPANAGDGWQRDVQRGAGLGARLEAAFAKLFRGGARKIVAIGTDTPWMPRTRIRLAFDWLDRFDVVLGPSLDGGYYLIGARRLVHETFRGIPWGSPNVLLATRRALERAGHTYRLLSVDFDLDRPEDLERAAELLRADPSRAPRLAAWLARRRSASN